MSRDDTPTPEAVAQAIDTLTEATGVHRFSPTQTQQQPSGSNPRSWHWITVFLSAVLAVGTLVGVLGRAFFVQRDEYTVSETANVVSHEAMRQTLDRVDRTLIAQTQALTEMAKAVQAQAVELATIKRHSEK
jgi:hypothetical protein